MNIARVFAIIALFSLTVSARRLFRSIVNPVTALALPFLLTLAYQEMSLRFLPFGWKASLIIVAGASALLLGHATTARARLSKGQAGVVFRIRADRRRSINMLEWCTVLLAIYYTRLLYTTISVHREGVLNGIFFRSIFYAGSGNTVLFRAMQAAMLAGSFLMALIAAARGYRRLPVLLFIGLNFYQAWISSTRAPFIILILMFGLAYAVTHATQLSRVRGRTLILSLVLTIALGSILTLVAYRRGATGGEVKQKIQFSLTGGPAAFSSYLDGDTQVDVYDRWGLTFGGLIELFTGKSRPLGIYQTNVDFASGNQAASTNIFTWYVPLLLDFGLLGTVTLLIVLGMVLAPAVQRVVGGRANVRSYGLLVCALLTLAYAPIAPLTYYNFLYALIMISFFLGYLFELVPTRPNATPSTPSAAKDLTGVSG